MEINFALGFLPLVFKGRVFKEREEVIRKICYRNTFGWHFTWGQAWNALFQLSVAVYQTTLQQWYRSKRLLIFLTNLKVNFTRLFLLWVSEAFVVRCCLKWMSSFPFSGTWAGKSVATGIFLSLHYIFMQAFPSVFLRRSEASYGATENSESAFPR